MPANLAGWGRAGSHSSEVTITSLCARIRNPARLSAAPAATPNDGRPGMCVIIPNSHARAHNDDSDRTELRPPDNGNDTDGDGDTLWDDQSAAILRLRNAAHGTD